jgi:hypothetical protein
MRTDLNIIGRLAKAIDNTFNGAPTLTDETSEEIFRQSRNGPVTVVLPQAADEFPNRELRPKNAPATPPKVDFFVAGRRAAAGIYEPHRQAMAPIIEINDRCQKIWNDVNFTYTPDAAKKAYAEQDKLRWQKFYETGDESILKSAAFTCEQMLADYAEKRAIARRVHEELCKDAARLCDPINAKFIVEAEAELGRLEAAESDEAASLGFVYNPGPRVQILRKLINFQRARQKDERSAPPKDILTFIKF